MLYFYRVFSRKTLSFSNKQLGINSGANSFVLGCVDILVFEDEAGNFGLKYYGATQ